MKAKEIIKNRIEKEFSALAQSEQYKANDLSPTIFVWKLWQFKRAGKKETVQPTGLYKTGFINFASDLGYKALRDPKVLVKIKHKIMTPASLTDIKHDILHYMESLDDEVELDFDGKITSIKKELLKEIYLNSQHIVVHDSLLVDHLPEPQEEILADTRQLAFLPFKNEIVKISANGITSIEYETSPYILWETRCIDQAFKKVIYQESPFFKFIQNVSGHDKARIDALMSMIGYLAHNYSATQDTKACAFVDEESVNSNDPEGGTGKGIVAQALSKLRAVRDIDGKKFKPDHQFAYQLVQPSDQIIHLNDVKPNFDVLCLNAILSDGLTVERKNALSFMISKEKSPKFLITSNSGLKTNGTTRKRRICLFPMANHYSSLLKKGVANPIIHEHCKAFFSEDWSAEEWDQFYSFMIDCLQQYLTSGLIELDQSSMKEICLKAETSLEFKDFILKNTTLDEEIDTKSFYETFLKSTGFEAQEVRQRRFSNWVAKYARIYGFSYKQITRNGSSWFVLNKN